MRTPQLSCEMRACSTFETPVDAPLVRKMCSGSAGTPSRSRDSDLYSQYTKYVSNKYKTTTHPPRTLLHSFVSLVHL